jgi:hypothetical protein
MIPFQKNSDRNVPAHRSQRTGILRGSFDQASKWTSVGSEKLEEPGVSEEHSKFEKSFWFSVSEEPSESSEFIENHVDASENCFSTEREAWGRAARRLGGESAEQPTGTLMRRTTFKK